MENQNAQEGKTSSEWLLMARDPRDLGSRQGSPVGSARCVTLDAPLDG